MNYEMPMHLVHVRLYTLEHKYKKLRSSLQSFLIEIQWQAFGQRFEPFYSTEGRLVSQAIVVDFCSIAGLRVGCESVSVGFKGFCC